jgi:hypothetical protein
MTFVVDYNPTFDRIIFVPQVYDFGDTIVEADSLEFARRAERQRLSVLEHQGRFRPGLSVLDFRKDSIVEDRTILEDFDEGRALVLVGAPQYMLQMGSIHVDDTSHEGGSTSQRE